MTERGYEEKDEKLEKQEEKQEKDERSWDEKARNDPLGAIVWALILIWAGIVFLVQNLGILDAVGGVEEWGLIFAGAGVILLLEAGARYVLPEYRRPIMGTVIMGLVFIAIGLGDMISWKLVGPLAIIGVGAAMLLGGLFRREE